MACLKDACFYRAYFLYFTLVLNNQFFFFFLALCHIIILCSSLQAYMSRAAYYGSKGRYSKAIMNCNEAIKILPNSARAYFYRGTLKYQNKVGYLCCCTSAFSLKPTYFTCHFVMVKQ